MASTTCLGIGGCKQQAAQILGEDLDGVLLGRLGQIAPHLALHAGKDQAVQRIDRRGTEQLGVGVAFERELAEEDGFDLGPGHIEPNLERTFLVAAVDGQHAMRRDLGDRLGVFEIIAVFEALPFGDLGLGGDDLAGFPHDPAHRVAHRGHLADGLGEDVADAFDDLFDRIDALLGIDEFLSRRGQIGERLVAGPDPEGQGLQARGRVRPRPWCASWA